MLTQSTFDFGLHGLQVEGTQSAGQWIRSLREERQIKGSDVERISRKIAERKQNRNFYIPHGTLADIENGSIPSIHKLFSLAICLRVSLHDLLFAFGICDEEINQVIAETPAEPRTRGDEDAHREYMRGYMRKWRAARGEAAMGAAAGR